MHNSLLSEPRSCTDPVSKSKGCMLFDFKLLTAFVQSTAGCCSANSARTCSPLIIPWRYDRDVHRSRFFLCRPAFSAARQRLLSGAAGQQGPRRYATRAACTIRGQSAAAKAPRRVQAASHKILQPISSSTLRKTLQGSPRPSDHTRTMIT